MQPWQQELLDTYFPKRVHDRRKWIDEYPGLRDKTVVHIPARGNSSRIPKKNIKMLGGKPLLAYTIESAKMMGVDRIVVNTDSPEIQEVAEQYGAEVPFLRPASISGGESPPGVASLYAICHLMAEDYPLDVVVDMYPTTPFRNSTILREYLEQTRRFGHCVTSAPFDVLPHS
ncbi:MAG: NTP transferase domain-containing protein [Okeania sp. SIO3B3]|nr:NTP transferase domain-containing protein [Okeania sp. SIO3B3]